jgi:cell division protein FtsB
MRTRFKRKKTVLRASLYLLGVGCLCYFAYHPVTGTFGLRSGKAMEARIAELELQSQTLLERKIYLEKQVKLMSDGTLEADMLDERARNLLAVSREDEIVIYR